MKDIDLASNSFEVPCRLQSISQMQPVLENLIAKYIKDPTRVYLVTLSVVEVLCNIVEHGFSGNPPENESVSIKVSTSSEGLSVQLSDCAAEIPSDTVAHMVSGQSAMPPIDRGTENLAESGWGLNIVTSTTTRIHYRRVSDTNIVTLDFENIDLPVNLQGSS